MRNVRNIEINAALCKSSDSEEKSIANNNLNNDNYNCMCTANLKKNCIFDDCEKIKIQLTFNLVCICFTVFVIRQRTL